MGIHLVLQGHVAVFGEVPFLPLGGQFPADVHRVFHQVYQAEDRHLHQEGDDCVPRQGRRIQPGIPVEGKAEGMQEGGEDAGKADEKGRADGGDVQAVVLVMSGAHEEQRRDEQQQHDEGIPQEQAEFVETVHSLEGALPEDEHFDEDSQGEHHDDRENEPSQTLLPARPLPGGDAVGPGEEGEGPSQDFRGEERGQGVVEQAGREVEHLCAHVSQGIPQDVHEDDADGGEFHREAPPLADEHGEKHRQGRENERVRDAGEGAHDGHHGVQRRESVNEPGCPNPFHIPC